MRFKHSLIILFLFVLFGKFVPAWIPNFDSRELNLLVLYASWLFAIVAGGALLRRSPAQYAQDLGITKPSAVSVKTMLIALVPLVAGAIFWFSFNPEVTVTKLLVKGVAAPFMEEFYFRGFLVLLLIRLAGWHFLLAALVNSLIFGLGHWYQGHDASQALMAALVTGVGGLWFAWLSVRWGTIWPAVILHGVMNSVWYLWHVDSNAIGGQTANLLRLTTIVLSVGLTLYYTRRQQVSNPAFA